ncbi:unnamed protein product [Urochloa humidicola]
MAGVSKLSYYVVLDVAQDASADEIHAAWRKMSEAFHPDKVEKAADKSWVKEFVLAKYRAVQEAYELLSDPAKKAIYDAGLHAHTQEWRLPDHLLPVVNVNTKKVEPAGRVKPPARVVQLNLSVSINKEASSDPGTSTSGRGGSGGGLNFRGKQRQRRR